MIQTTDEKKRLITWKDHHKHSDCLVIFHSDFHSAFLLPCFSIFMLMSILHMQAKASEECHSDSSWNRSSRECVFSLPFLPFVSPHTISIHLLTSLPSTSPAPVKLSAVMILIRCLGHGAFRWCSTITEAYYKSKNERTIHEGAKAFQLCIVMWTFERHLETNKRRLQV